MWFSQEDRELYGDRGARLTHCPTANLKLASGVADVRAHKSPGITVGIGADGMPCNNRADVFEEMRLAGLKNVALMKAANQRISQWMESQF